MLKMLTDAAIDAVGEPPDWWEKYFAIGEDGGGGFYLMKRDGSPQVWLMDSDWHDPPQAAAQSLEEFLDS